MNFDLKLDSFESSNLKDVEYCSDSNVLRATFKSGNPYLYFRVPVTVFQQLQAAESKGKAFNELVKKGGYSYKKE